MADADNGFVYAGVTRWGGGGSQTAKPDTLGGVFRMPVGGDNWTHMMTGFPEVVHVHCLTIHPTKKNVLFAGTHQGVYRSEDFGESWVRMQLDPLEQQIWSIAISPLDDAVMFAGASPIGMYVSHDAGESWDRVEQGSVDDRLEMGTFKNRVMRIAFNPKDPMKLCAALEVNGSMASDDGGKTWQDRNDDLIRISTTPERGSAILTKSEAEGMLDGHALCMMPDNGTSVFYACRMGIFRSDDNGRTWNDLHVGKVSDFTYGRDIRPSLCEPNTLFACLSVSSRGHTGSLWKSGDGGESWQRLAEEVTPKSTVSAVAPHPENPEVLYFSGRNGEGYGTVDGGRTWSEHPLPEGCQGVYCLACA